MFRFVDPQSLRMMALRSDITPQIGRIAGTRMAAAPRPLRLCYAGQVVTIKGDGLDPAREKLQCGAELIGATMWRPQPKSWPWRSRRSRPPARKGVSVDFTLPDLVDTLAGRGAAAGAGPDRRGAPRTRYQGCGRPGRRGGEAYVPLLYATGDFATAIDKLAAIDAGGALPGALPRCARSRCASMRGLTLDPSERHGFEYQSWFGFVLYAEGVRGALGRGGTYRIAAPDADGRAGEVATGFSLYRCPDRPDRQCRAAGDKLFLPLGHDRAAADRLRAIGWRTVAALSEADEAATLGCSRSGRSGAGGAVTPVAAVLTLAGRCP
jgi:ATP phosphoribosyltransferase regulatory subunit